MLESVTLCHVRAVELDARVSVGRSFVFARRCLSARPRPRIALFAEGVTDSGSARQRARWAIDGKARLMVVRAVARAVFDGALRGS